MLLIPEFCPYVFSKNLAKLESYFAKVMEILTKDTDQTTENLFRWHHPELKVLCFGFVRQLIGFMQFDDIANIIFDYSKITCLEFIHHKSYSDVEHTTCQTCSGDTVSGLHCNFTKKTPGDSHSSSTVLIKPFISTLLSLSSNDNNQNANNINNLNLHDNHVTTNIHNSINIPKTCVKLTIKLQKHNCLSDKYGDDGYLLQCGLLCVPKKKILSCVNDELYQVNVKSDCDSVSLAVHAVVKNTKANTHGNIVPSSNNYNVNLQLNASGNSDVNIKKNININISEEEKKKDNNDHEIQNYADSDNNSNNDIDNDDIHSVAKKNYLERLELLFSIKIQHYMSDSVLFKFLRERMESAFAKGFNFDKKDRQLFGKHGFNVISMTFSKAYGIHTCTFDHHGHCTPTNEGFTVAKVIKKDKTSTGSDNTGNSDKSGPDAMDDNETHFVKNDEFVQVCVEKDSKEDGKYFVYFCKQYGDNGKIYTFEESKIDLNFDKMDYLFGFSSARCCCKSGLAPQLRKDIGFEWDAFLECQ